MKILLKVLCALCACLLFCTWSPKIHAPQAHDVISSFHIPTGARTKTHRALGFRAKRITIDLRKADVRSVLRLLSKEGGVNIIAGPEVKGTITAHLDRVLVRDAFWGVVRSHNLRVEKTGTVIVVAKK